MVCPGISRSIARATQIQWRRKKSRHVEILHFYFCRKVREIWRWLIWVQALEFFFLNRQQGSKSYASVMILGFESMNRGSSNPTSLATFEFFTLTSISIEISVFSLSRFSTKIYGFDSFSGPCPFLKPEF